MLSRPLVVLVVVGSVLVAGCAGGDTGTGPIGPAADDADNSNASGNGGLEKEEESIRTVTYTSRGENASLRVRADKIEKTYDFRMEMYANFTEAKQNPLMTVKGIANFTMEFGCGFLGQITYNYTEFAEQHSEPFQGRAGDQFNRTTNTGEQEQTDTIPKKIMTDYKPDTVEVVIYGVDGEQRYGRCTAQNATYIDKEFFVE